MSNWGRPYIGSGGNNRDYCYRPQQNSPNTYPPMDQSWQVYQQRHQNNQAHLMAPRNEQSGYSVNNDQNTELPAAFCGGAIDREIWEKAANSTLVPTAGEFFPSVTYHSSNFGLHNSPANSNFSSNSGWDASDVRNSQTSFTSSSSSAAGPSTSSSHIAQHQQHQNQQRGRIQRAQNGYSERAHQNSKEYYSKQGKPAWDKNRNGARQVGSGRSFGRGPGPGSGAESSWDSGPGSGPSLEEMKNEGRRKLLEEAAAFLTSTRTSGADTGNSSEVLHQSGSTSQEDSKKFHSNNSENSNSKSYTDYRRPTSRSDRGGGEHYYNKSGKPFTNDSNTSSRQPYTKDRSQFSNANGDITVSQRDRLTEQLNRGTLECLVCYERVRQHDSVWNCSNCHHVLHLRCIIKWAQSSRADNGWRCPACQNVTALIPSLYTCFCGKVTDPEWNRNDTAHSCGEVCNKPKPNSSPYVQCQHKCTLLCHPGPCPPCITMVQRKCGCGRTSQVVQCGHVSKTFSCGSECSKPLECGEHFCSQICHLDDCKPCPVMMSQVCYCGSNTREVPCDGKNTGVLNYECGGPCQRKLVCDQHPCDKMCHTGPCGVCPLDPATVTHCPCGKVQLDKNVNRQSCLDPVPTCAQTCGKPLKCGQPSTPHLCKSLCHESLCPPCEMSTLVRCRCGHMDRAIPCKDLTTKADDARCQKRCTKKRSCGKHKCNQLCCIEVDHVCPMPCNHMLSCGQHRCEDLCHKGYCRPCWRSSFEELYCECGSEVIFPPVPCGTRPPECVKPCTRQHDCEHPALHNCHSAQTCPPCSVLTAKYCHGKHELRKTVPCHQQEFSCGLPCGKELSCGHHKCITICHKGDCLKPGQSCVQPCTKPRPLCGHACGAPCHEGDCPDTLCKEKVKVTCECANRSTVRSCCENNKEYQRIATSLLASKMADVQLGRSIDLQDMQGARKMSLKSLECNDECRLVERNRRLSIGLQIRNPDLTAKLTPRYSEFMRNWSKKDPNFCQNIHDKLTELVQLAKQSKQKSRSYSFDTMNREKRQFVHEYCEHFGCESIAYDAEPKRNVVATAQRDKAWLPSYSLLEVLQRESGHRKVPLPSLNAVKKNIASSSTARSAGMVPVRISGNNASSPTVGSCASSKSTHEITTSASGPTIDYFDYQN